MLWIGDTYDTSVVLEIEEDTIEALPGLGLADDDGGVNFLAELGLSLLDGGHDHVTNTTSGQSVETSTDTLDGDDVKVASTRVVGAVHDGTTISLSAPIFLLSFRSAFAIALEKRRSKSSVQEIEHTREDRGSS